MPSKHKNISKYLRSGFFEGIKSFRDFEERTKKFVNTTEVGDAFEILVEAYLYNDKVLNAKNVWLVGDIPLKVRTELNLPSDSTGIDGVYEDASGKIIPYQVKYRTDTDTLPFGDVSPFLGITEKSLQDRVIFTNARNLADKITNRKGIRSVRAAQFHDLTEKDFQDIFAWLSGKKPEFKRWLPLPHQKEAIEKITAELKQANRATAVMACGTGKTLVALWAAEAQKPKTVLVLVPSLALLSQTLPDWCKQTSWGDSFRYLCVCSDASVDRSAKNDEYALRQSDLEFSVTTDAKQVQAFLSNNQSGVNVIFSTYQSAEVVAAGLKGKSVDFAIFDEAHKTTGPKEGLFAFGLSDKNISIKKRLFLTATPRHYKLNKRDKDGDFQTVSMDDVEVYGKVSYRLSFSAAVAAGIIVPYKVIISLSLNKDVDDELLRQGSTFVRRNQIQAKWVANQIALKRAIKKTSASKIITFHSRVSLAKEFAGDDSRGFSEHVKGFDVFHVNGEQNAADRKALLDGFKTAPKSLITNARCLTEGVDVPAVDMVAFVDPRKSRIDIAQAAGRAMRKSKDKKLGYIVVPLFIEQKKGETEEAALARSGFDEVAMVLGAMLENDEDLKDVISEMQQARGRGEKFNPKQLEDKVEVIGPAIDLNKLKRSIDIEILDRLGVSWDRWYGLLQKFHKREGHCRVEAKYEEDGLSLGNWIQTQRHTKDQLSAERIEKLNSLGFIWDVLAEQWEYGFSILKQFHAREGHTRVARKHKEAGFHLGSWIGNQRRGKGQLPLVQVEKLNSLGFSWDLFAEQWEQNFEALKIFLKREGHTRVPSNHSEGKLKLGTWTLNQRSTKNKLPHDRVQRLNTIGFCWDVDAEVWDEYFNLLAKFYKREGHTEVPQRHKERGISLGVWVNNLRHKKENISAERIKRLDALGFPWNPHAGNWEKYFNSLKAFRNRERHVNVPQRHREGGLRLGNWVSGLRLRRESLTADQFKRLDSLNFIWDSPRAEQWEQGFAALLKFYKREGHTNVPQKQIEGTFRLGTWVSNQRLKKHTFSNERIKRLNAVGFLWKARSDNWKECFEALKKFSKRNGNTRVPKDYQEGEIKLGIWVQNQRSRRNKNNLTSDKVKLLDAIGFSWSPFTEMWESVYKLLLQYFNREGHSRVPVSHVEQGVKLGRWASTQRFEKDKLSKNQISRLNALGFTWKM